LFIGTGKALAYGGPGNMLIAYLIVCAGVWGNVQSLIEMTILYPTSGNFVDYAGRWVDPAVAFGAGFAEWLGMHSPGNKPNGDRTDILQDGLPSLEARQYSSVSSLICGLKVLFPKERFVSTQVCLTEPC
jgi:hypothetical protein